MRTSRMAMIALLVVLGTALAGPAAGQAPTCMVTTTWSFYTPPFTPPAPPTPSIPITYTSIAAALNSTPAYFTWGTATVSGVCTEPNLFISERFSNLNLIGNATGTRATIQATAQAGDAITIRGRNITIKGFTITSFGLNGNPGAKYGVEVYRGGTALIDNCVIDGFAGEGIGVIQHAFARIVNTSLQNNGGGGILVHENSAVRVGFTSTDDPVPQGNTIQNNAMAGIRVNRTSSARIANNVIAGNGTGNGDAGIVVQNGSHADIASNDLSENAGAGIRIHLNSSARVGTGIGRADWDVPNSTTTPNLGAGLECTLGGAVEGTLGTLTGHHGPHKFGQGCVHDLTH